MSTSSKKHSSIFLIGAAKCGTTALADFLDRHSNISLSKPKESDFFTNRVFPRGFDWYDSLFDIKGETKYRLDASVSYSIGWGTHGSENVAKRIREYDKNSILIYLVRDPVARAWSSYWHDMRNFKIKETPEQTILNPDSAHYRGGMYYQRLSEYLKFFDKEQILVFTQDSFREKPLEILDNINQILQLDGLRELACINERQVNASYQFNKVGKIITKVIPLDFIKTAANFSNHFFPSYVNKVIRDKISKPIPIIEDSFARKIASIYTEDANALFNLYGVDVRSGPWWNK